MAAITAWCKPAVRVDALDPGRGVMTRLSAGA